MNEQRRQVLGMLAEGRITADEAERLLDALDRERPAPSAKDASRPGPRPRYLRVMVNWVDDGEGPGCVNVQIPLRLLRAGVQLAGLVPPQALARVNAELHRSGVPFDLTELKPRHIEEFVEQLDEVTVDVEQPDGKVLVFCE